MARIRTFKPEFLRHELLQDIETKNPGKYPMFVFQGLWSVCDKQGVFPWKPRSLKLDIYPFLKFEMGETLAILAEAGFIRKYTASDGEEYGNVINFEKHQRINGDEAKLPAKYPSPCEEVEEINGEAGTKQLRSSGEAGKKQERSGNENGKGKERSIGIGMGKGKEDFSLSDELNPSSKDFSQRVEKLRTAYNELKIGPPFKKTAVNLNPGESSDLLRIMQVYDDEVSVKAMENYQKIKSSPVHDPGGCIYQGFVSFMIRGVEKYCDEANPFENFKKVNKSGAGPPLTNQQEKISL
jgi:hypothetical protein